MNQWLVLLRGINVGGKNIVPMKQLSQMLSELGCGDIKTYIQSGNVLLQHEELQNHALSELIANSMQVTFGFKPHLLLLTRIQLEQAIANNPYIAAQSDSKNLHLFFLAEQSGQRDFAALNQIKASTESFELIGRIFYLYAPDGIGRSKLAKKVEKVLGVAVTARNWNTVTKLLTL
jgi:uncharacterized protein (DUF1697 family)